MKKYLTPKTIGIFALVLVVLGVSAFYAYNALGKEDTQISDEPQMQTAVVRRGDLVVFASGTGSIIPAQEVNLGFTENGTLSELLVKVGDHVEKGQVLARLQTNNTEESITSAIASSQLAVLNAEKALEELTKSDPTEKQVKLAQAQQAITAAQEKLIAAERELDEFEGANYQYKLDLAEQSVEDALDGLEQSKEDLEPYLGRDPEDTTRQYFEQRLAEAEREYAEAVRQREELKISKIKAEQSVKTANAELDNAKTEYQDILNSPDPMDIAIAQAQLDNAKAQLALTEEKQVYVDLVAPMDGTIVFIKANVGENVGTNAFIGLADLEQPMLEIYLDETDIDKVAVGNEVEAEFDAYPGETYKGQVVEVDPSLVTVSNVQAVRALASLDKDSFNKPLMLPVGLSASVDVIGGRAENVVLVPVEALRELGPDEYAVFVIENGEPKLRVVEIGLVDITSAEIISGLNPGEIVTTGIVETK